MVDKDELTALIAFLDDLRDVLIKHDAIIRADSLLDNFSIAGSSNYIEVESNNFYLDTEKEALTCPDLTKIIDDLKNEKKELE